MMLKEVFRESVSIRHWLKDSTLTQRLCHFQGLCVDHLDIEREAKVVRRKGRVRGRVTHYDRYYNLSEGGKTIELSYGSRHDRKCVLTSLSISMYQLRPPK